MMAIPNNMWTGTTIGPMNARALASGLGQTYNSAQGYSHLPAYEIMMKVPFAVSATPAPEVLMTQVKLAIASATEKFEQDGGKALRFVAQHISDHCDAFTKGEYEELSKLIKAPYDAQAQGRAAETFMRINMGESPETSEQKLIREKQEYEAKRMQAMQTAYGNLGGMSGLQNSIQGIGDPAIVKAWYEQHQKDAAAQEKQSLINRAISKIRKL